MRLFLIALLLTGVCLTSAYAADGTNTAQGAKLTFEQRKAQILSNIDERIAKYQALKECITPAQSPKDVKACREKFASKQQGQNKEGPAK
jgi:hypothetical protein